MKSINEVNAVGRIIETGMDQYGHAAITVAIRGKRLAFLNFAIKDGLDPDLGVGDSVRIKGHCKAYRGYSQTRQGMANIQYFVADEIEREVSEMEKRFGIAGRFPPSHCRAYFAGEVMSSFVTRDPQWGKITVKVDGQGDDPNPSFIQLSYRNSWNFPPFDYERGDKVCIVASISTPQKELNGVQVKFENFVIEDIVRVEEGQEIHGEQEPGSEQVVA